MKQITAGIIAHVDAGKTTLSEALLYQSGTTKKLGRVDKQDAFLDTDALEKQRGITIFSHQASLVYQDLKLTLLDTPGHVDFASQTEQVLAVLDYAILVVSATDGVQGYTRTLWRLLARYHVPTFIFVNKMDVDGADKAQLLTQLQSTLAKGCIAFDGNGALSDETQEAIALQDDAVLETYLDSGALSQSVIAAMIQKRQVFPCYFGAALKLSGIEALLAGLEKWSIAPDYADTAFGAKVFKISYDDKKERLTWLRLTGGQLQPKTILLGTQKVNQMRQYQGDRFTILPQAHAGDVVAIPGLTDTHQGQGLGVAADGPKPVLTPVLTYALDQKDYDLQTCLSALKQLEDEDPLLHVSWSSHVQEIRVQLMGAMQLEVLKQQLLDRFGLAVAFDAGSILYRETISQSVEGVGHFEPLRHYAEVHLLLEPALPGSGLSFESDCAYEVLDHNWQHQVLDNLGAKTHLGVLIGAPITDMRLTLIGGRASNVHTVGGDFREATWRAVRQGLMMLRAKKSCVLLEPWYRFRLEVGQDQIGRAMTDIQRMSGTFNPPETAADKSTKGDTLITLTGEAPVSSMRDYTQTVYAYTHGQGQLECLIAGYRPCHNAAAVIAAQDYHPVSDLDNTPDSVFCAHGAGYPVPWDAVPQMAHVAYTAPIDKASL